MFIMFMHHKFLTGEDEYLVYATKNKHFGVEDSGEDLTDVSRYRGGNDLETDDDDVECPDIEAEATDKPKTGMPKKARLENYLPTGEYTGKYNDNKARACLPTHYMPHVKGQRLPASPLKCFKHNYRSVAPCVRNIDIPQGPSMYEKQSEAFGVKTYPKQCGVASRITSRSTCCGGGDIMEVLPDGRDAASCVLVKRSRNAAELMKRCATPLVPRGYTRTSMYDGYQNPSTQVSTCPPVPPRCCTQPRQSACSEKTRVCSVRGSIGGGSVHVGTCPSTQVSTCPPVPPRCCTQPRQSACSEETRVCGVRGSIGGGSVHVGTSGGCGPCQSGLHDFSRPQHPKGFITNPGRETKLCPHEFNAGKTACCSTGPSSCCSRGPFQVPNPHTSACLPPDPPATGPDYFSNEVDKCLVPDLCLLDDKRSYNLCPKPLLPPCGHIECAAPVELDAPRKVDIRILERPPPREHDVKWTHFDARTNLMTKYGVDLPDPPCHYSK